jgi:hypothetical protein
VEFRFAQLGIHEPEKVEYGRFLRLLLGSLHNGLSIEERAKIDAALTPPDAADVARRTHRKQHEALGSMASAEYRRVMTDRRSTPEQRAEVRWREMQRMAAAERRRVPARKDPRP